MSETTGWTRVGGTYRKKIDGNAYVIHKRVLWVIMSRSGRVGARQYLADAKRVAHRHAVYRAARHAESQP